MESNTEIGRVQTKSRSKQTKRTYSKREKVPSLKPSQSSLSTKRRCIARSPELESDFLDDVPDVDVEWEHIEARRKSFDGRVNHTQNSFSLNSNKAIGRANVLSSSSNAFEVHDEAHIPETCCRSFTIAGDSTMDDESATQRGLVCGSEPLQGHKQVFHHRSSSTLHATLFSSTSTETQTTLQHTASTQANKYIRASTPEAALPTVSRKSTPPSSPTLPSYGITRYFKKLVPAPSTLLTPECSSDQIEHSDNVNDALQPDQLDAVQSPIDIPSSPPRRTRGRRRLGKAQPTLVDNIMTRPGQFRYDVEEEDPVGSVEQDGPPVNATERVAVTAPAIPHHQTVLNLGQKTTSVCPTCKFVFNAAMPHDRSEHRKVHEKFEHGISVKDFTRINTMHEAVVWTDVNDNQAQQILVIDQHSKPSLQNLGENALRYADEFLLTCEGAVQHFLPNFDSKLYLFVSNGHVKGLLLIEKVRQAKAMFTIGNNSNEVEIAGNVTADLMGVNLIWTIPNQGRHGIATRLVDIARKEFGAQRGGRLHSIMRFEVAYTQPTEQGRAFATKYSRHIEPQENGRAGFVAHKRFAFLQYDEHNPVEKASTEVFFGPENLKSVGLSSEETLSLREP